MASSSFLYICVWSVGIRSGYDCVEALLARAVLSADGVAVVKKKNSVVVDAIMLNIYVDILFGEVFGEFLAPHIGDRHCGLRIEVEGDHNR